MPGSFGPNAAEEVRGLSACSPRVRRHVTWPGRVGTLEEEESAAAAGERRTLLHHERAL